MADFKIGDKVRISFDEGEYQDKTGVIVDKGAMPTVTSGEIVPGKELKPEMRISWWKVRLDRTGEEKDFPDDKLS